MEFMSWYVVGIMLIVGGGSMFLGAAHGHYKGYKTGYSDAVRERDGMWKDRLSTVTQNVESRIQASYVAGRNSTKDH